MPLSTILALLGWNNWGYEMTVQCETCTMIRNTKRKRFNVGMRALPSSPSSNAFVKGSSQADDASTSAWTVTYRQTSCQQEPFAKVMEGEKGSTAQTGEGDILCTQLVAGLEPRQQYSIKVRAFSEAGYGQWSAPYVGTTNRPSGTILNFYTNKQGFTSVS